MLFKPLLFVGSVAASCLHGLYRREEGEVEIPNFGYEDTFGPLNWAALAPENEACKTGKNQSPINIGMCQQPCSRKRRSHDCRQFSQLRY